MEPKAFEIYRHFKGNLYQVLTLAEDEGSGDMLVIYQGLYAPFKVYARPLISFTERLDPAKYPDAAQEYRFERVTDPKAAAVPFAGAHGDRSDTSAADERLPGDKAAEVMTAARPVERLSERQPAENAAGGINPDLLLFLDAREPEDKLDALFRIKSRLTPDMLTAIEMSQGMEPQETWTIEERYKHIKNDIITKQKYEQKRI